MPRTKRTEQAPAPVQPLPLGGNVTDNDLIAENHKLEDQIKAGLAKFNEWAKPMKERIKEIEDDIFARLVTRGADSTKTDAGTAYFSDIMNTKVENPEALFDFVAENWGAADAKISMPVAAVRQHMEANEGKPPPGISISFFKNLNIRRS